MATSLRAGRVRLAVFPSAASTLVPRALARMRERHPGIEVHLREAEPPQARGAAVGGERRRRPGVRYVGEREPAGCHHVDLGEDPVNLVTPRRSGERADLAQYRDARWIAGCEQCRGELLELTARAGLEPGIRCCTDDFVAVQHLVASGFGVALLPSPALAAFRHPGVEAPPYPARTGRFAR